LNGGAETRVPDDDELRARLLREVRRFCPGWMRDSADDIAQIAWMRLDEYRKKSERNRAPGPTLIAKIAYCATVDEMRRHGRRREFSMETAPETVREAQAGPEARARAREIAGAIRSCLLRLSGNRTLAVTLYLQGHTAPETGRILGWSLRKTENLIFRGMSDLRRCLASKGVRP
jgi:RNA polymerase sigma-70 factor (ECF subfamily)